MYVCMYVCMGWAGLHAHSSNPSHAVDRNCMNARTSSFLSTLAPAAMSNSMQLSWPPMNASMTAVRPSYTNAHTQTQTFIHTEANGNTQEHTQACENANRQFNDGVILCCCCSSLTTVSESGRHDCVFWLCARVCCLYCICQVGEGGDGKRKVPHDCN